MIGTTAALIAGGLSAGGSIFGGAKGAGAAKSAASIQAKAAQDAMKQEMGMFSDYTRNAGDVFGTNVNRYQPYADIGLQGSRYLSDALDPSKQGGGFLLQGYGGELPGLERVTPGSFQDSAEAKAAGWKGGVTGEDVKAQFDPGFNYRMGQANKAIERWAASRGSSDNPATAMKLMRNSQDMASQEYQNAFGRAVGLNQQQYGQGMGAFEGNFGQRLAAANANFGQGVTNYGLGANTFYQNQQNYYNRLAGLSEMGQRAVGGQVQASENYLGDIGGLTGQTMRSISDLTTGKGASEAAGQVGASNAWTGALNNAMSGALDWASLAMGNAPKNNSNMRTMPSNYSDVGWNPQPYFG